MCRMESKAIGLGGPCGKTVLFSETKQDRVSGRARGRGELGERRNPVDPVDLLDPVDL